MGDAVNMNCLGIPGIEVHVVFGGLAIVVTFVTVDPLALRPRLSPGLPLSNSRAETVYLLEENGEPGNGPSSPLQLKYRSMIFGGLAIMVTNVTLDPLALRPWFSPGLPFSYVFFTPIVYWFHLITPYSFVVYAN